MKRRNKEGKYDQVKSQKVDTKQSRAGESVDEIKQSRKMMIAQ